MNFIERSLLSLKIKKKNSLSLLVTSFLIFTLVFIGFYIQDATKVNAVKARKKLGADVSLQLDHTKVMQSAQTEAGFTTPPLTVTAVKELAKLSEVKEYQISTSGIALKNPLKSVEPSSKAQNPFGSSSDSSSDMKSPSFTITGLRESKYASDFKDSTSKLVAGQAITSTDQDGAALIEEQLAEKNHLKVGDSFQIANFDNKKITLKVKGIFRSNKKLDLILASFEATQPANQIYTDYKSAAQFNVVHQEGVQEATFYLKDPLLIDKFIKQAKKVDTVSSYYTFDAHDETYQQLVGPLKQVQGFCSSLVLLSLVIGLFILIIVILTNIRNRRFEMEILLSLGETKRKIIGQLLTEILVVAVLAFGLSSVLSIPLGQGVANFSLNQQVQKSEQSSQTGIPAQSFVGGNPTAKTAPISSVKINYSSKVFCLVSSISLTILLVATLIPSCFILRLKPKILFEQED